MSSSLGGFGSSTLLCFCAQSNDFSRFSPSPETLNVIKHFPILLKSCQKLYRTTLTNPHLSKLKVSFFLPSFFSWERNDDENRLFGRTHLDTGVVGYICQTCRTRSATEVLNYYPDKRFVIVVRGIRGRFMSVFFFCWLKAKIRRLKAAVRFSVVFSFFFSQNLPFKRREEAVYRGERHEKCALQLRDLED